MPAKLRSLPTHQPTIMPKPTETITSSNVNINKDVVLRSGKWTPEEELYANILIELFEEGCVDEFEKEMNGDNDPTSDDDKAFKVSNGMTLRAYLSKKLFCSPMRISKKFAGRGIGKLVYMSQRSASYNGFQQRFPYGSRRIYNNRVFSLPSHIHVTKLGRLKETESNFLSVAFPNEIPPQMRKRKSGSDSLPLESPEKLARKSASLNNQSDVGNFQSDWDKNQLVHHQHGREQNSAAIGESVAPTTASSTSFPQHSQQQYATNNSYLPLAPYPNKLQQQQPCNHLVQNQGLQGHKAADNYRATPVVSSGTSSVTSSPNSPSQQHPAPLMAAPKLLAPKPEMPPRDVSREYRQSQVEVLKEAYISSVSPQKSQVSKRENAQSQLNHNNEMGNGSGLHYKRYADPMQMPYIGQSLEGRKITPSQTPTIDPTSSTSKDDNIGNSQPSTKPENASAFDWSQTMSPPKPVANVPNFLSGFDKVSKQQLRNTFDENIENDTVCDMEQIAEISPAYHTSKSFDDFHRYLGKGLSPQILPGPKFPSLRKNSTGPGIPSMRSPDCASMSKLHLRPRNPQNSSPISRDNANSLTLGEAYKEAMGPSESQHSSPNQPYTAQDINLERPGPANGAQKQRNSDELSDFPIEGMLFEDFDTLAPYTDARNNPSTFPSDRCAVDLGV